MNKSKAPSSSRVPKGWPPDVQYMTTPTYHSSVSPDVLAFLSSLPPTPKAAKVDPATLDLTPGVSSIAAIRVITDPAHPAYGQRGLFAVRKLAPRTHLLDYIGVVHCDERPSSDYDLSLHRTAEVSVGVDASVAGNEARFANDYRGVAQRPNAVFQGRRTERGELRMALFVGPKEVKKGEEILVSYGKAWWRARVGEEKDTFEKTHDLPE